MTRARSKSDLKDSGTVWLGHVPHDWDVAPVGRFARFHNGFDYSEVEVPDGGFPVYGSGGEFRRASQYLHDGESVLFGRKGTIDKPLYVQGKFWTVDTMYYTSFDEHLLPKFAYYWAQTLPFGRWLTSTALPSMTQSDLKRIQIAVPRPAEQHAVIAYLDRETAEIDAFIADQEKLIELLTERRGAVIAHAVVPASVGAAPGHQMLPLRRFDPSSESGTSVNASTMPAGPGEVGVLKTGAASSGVFLPKENKAVVLDEVHRVTVPVRPGAVLLNRANTPALVGSIAYVNQEAPDLYLSDKLWQIDFARADARFVAFWAQTRAYRTQIEAISVGASSSMQNLSFTDFLGIRMPNLPRREQEEIANRLEVATSKIEAAIADAREAIALSKERRAALISASVTGKIDVREHRKVKA